MSIDRGPSPATKYPLRVSDSHGLCIVEDRSALPYHSGPHSGDMIADGYPAGTPASWSANRDDFAAIVHRYNAHEDLCARLDAGNAGDRDKLEAVLERLTVALSLLGIDPKAALDTARQELRAILDGGDSTKEPR